MTKHFLFRKSDSPHHPLKLTYLTKIRFTYIFSVRPYLVLLYCALPAIKGILISNEFDIGRRCYFSNEASLSCSFLYLLVCCFASERINASFGYFLLNNLHGAEIFPPKLYPPGAACGRRKNVRVFFRLSLRREENETVGNLLRRLSFSFLFLFFFQESQGNATYIREYGTSRNIALSSPVWKLYYRSSNSPLDRADLREKRASKEKTIVVFGFNERRRSRRV